MTKQFVSIVHHPKLYNILDEINSLFSFELIDFENTNFFLKELEGSNANTLKSAIITKKK